MKCLTITVGHPLPILNPNRFKGRHWRAVADAKKVCRKEAYYATREALGRAWQGKIVWPERRVRVNVTMVYTDERYVDIRGPFYVDDDNLIGSLKATRDGLADGGLVTNDRYFVQGSVTRALGDKPVVILQLTPVD